MKLVWSDPAVDDLGAIRDYIARDSEHYATRFISQILEAVDRLESLPELGRQVPEATDQPNVRELLFRSYRIFYRVEAERILILAIVHGKRDLSRGSRPWEIN
ncbi:MAG: type II toxin-antitoxin system RelE/ParE family toxin [Thermoanaerobaculia bacterium]|nr:type II toxin-antitoxin system RelE/ParE family toxin [Thermoanaerobaculia bacterium]